MTIPPPVLTLSQILDAFSLEQVNAEFFVGTQIDEIDHHIVGGHIAAQALMAASRTVSERSPHSMHVYFLRCLAVYVSGRTLLEPAVIAHRTTPLGPGNSALMDHAVWFHRAPDLSDWLLYEQHSANGIGGRGLVQGTMYNHSGQLVCTTMLEGYFGRGPQG